MRFKFLTKEWLKKLPRNTGVYCFSAKNGSAVDGKNNKEILYIGKATNIQERVKNHFSQPGFKEEIFLNKTRRIGFIKSDSEIEALLLEAKLIRKYRPKYNIMWRDDKNYFFVARTPEDFPQIFITHQPQTRLQVTGNRLQSLKSRKLKPKIYHLTPKLVGPFVDGKALKQTLKILRKVFPFRSCKKLPNRPCLWYQLDRCLAPCTFKTGFARQIPSAQNKIKNRSQKNARNIFQVLKGEKNKVLKELEKEMRTAAKFREFEKASDIRDKIFALTKIISHSRLPAFENAGLSGQAKIFDWFKIQKELKNLIRTNKEIFRIEAYDISNIQGQEATGSMVTFINGKPDKNFYRKFKIKISGKPNDVAMIKEIIKRRFGHKEWPFPDLVLIDGGIAQLHAAKSEIKNKKIPIMALAKRKNELFAESREPIFLKNLPREIFNLVLQLRDEAHRFALAYHLKLRKKRLIE